MGASWSGPGSTAPRRGPGPQRRSSDPWRNSDPWQGELERGNPSRDEFRSRDSWQGGAADRVRSNRLPSERAASEGLDQGLDRLVAAGRQLVDGVSGARPGSRPAGRSGGRGVASLPRLNDLGRWVENKLDWILDDEDDWAEPWQEEPPRPSRQPSRSRLEASRPEPAPAPRRRPLDAISRRGPERLPSTAAQPAPELPAEDWPDSDSFSLPRWQRPSRPAGGAAESRFSQDRPTPAREGTGPSGRPMPRSSRRRPG